MNKESWTALFKELGVSQRKFAQSIAMDAAYMSRVVNGKAAPTERLYLLAEKVYGVNGDWLRTGKGEMFLDSSSSVGKRRVKALADELTDEEAQAVLAFVRYLRDNEIASNPD